MSVFKQFNTNEVVITPFYANKRFQFIGSQITASNAGIEYYQSMQGPYISGSFPTGFGTILDEVLVFNSTKQLYYSNYLTSSTGDNLTTSSVVPGLTPEFNSFVGPTTGPRFDNFLQSSIQQNRQYAQFSASTAIEGPSVISIPSKLFGEKIPPSTFNFTYTSSNLPHIESFVYDDSEGNLMATQSNPNGDIVYTGSVGQIFYSQGMAALTGVDSGDLCTFAQLVGSNGVAFGALISGLSVLGTTAGAAKTSMGSVAGPFTVTPSSAVTSGTSQEGAGASFSLTNFPGTGNLLYATIVATGAYYVLNNVITITEAELLTAGFIGVSGDLTITLAIDTRIVTPNSNIDSASLAFSSSITIRENQYKCTVRDNEYSYTYNPSALRPSNQLSMANNQLSSSIYLSETTYPNDGDIGIYILGYSHNSLSIGERGTATVTIETLGGGTTVSNITTSFPGTAYSVGDIIFLNMAQQADGAAIIPNATGLISFQLSSTDISFPANTNSINSTYYDFATGSDFSPYVTTIGLYNETNQLVAVGKLPQPLPISLYTDTTFVVNFDT